MRNRFLILTLITLLAAPWAASAGTAEHQGGPLTIVQPWARATAPSAKAGAAFMTIHNNGGTPDRLIGASTEVAEKAELHTHIKEGDVMRMRPVKAIDIPAGGTTELRPGGFHIMLIGLKHPLQEGEHFPLTLTFAGAGSIAVEVEVTKGGAMGHGPMGKHKAM